MSVTAYFDKPDIFTSDNPNIIMMSSTLQTTPVFHFRVETYKGGVLVGTDKVYKNPISTLTEFDLSIYTRYLTPLDTVVNYSVKITEIVNEIAGLSLTINKNGVIKGWINQSELEYFRDNFDSYFLTKFRKNRFAPKWASAGFNYGVSLNATSVIVRKTYDASGSLTNTTTTAPMTSGKHVDLVSDFYLPSTERMTLGIYTGGVLKDELSFTHDPTDCGGYLLVWRNEFGCYEYMYLFHNIIDESNINSFDYSKNEAKNVYLKTWMDGGTIYTDDLSDYEQKRLKNMLQSPEIGLINEDEFGGLQHRLINVKVQSWKLNQTYFEDAMPFSIPFEFTDLQKSILL